MKTMKKMKTTFLAFALFAFCIGGRAQTVTVADVEALPGETVAFTLNLADGKANTYTAMQFDAQFPVTGFSTTGKYKVSELWENATATVGAVNAEGIATIPVASSESISAADVEGLFSVSFTVGEGVAIGNYDVTLKNLWFGYGTSSKDYLDDVTFTVHVVSAHAIVLDENSTTAPDAAEGVNVTVKRTISANTWSTICLPFAMTEAQVKTAFGDDVELGDFTGYDLTEDGDDIIGITVNFDSATEIEANHPYIIKVGTPVTEFTVDDVDISPEDVPCVSFGFTTGKGSKAVYHPIDFNGTYVADFDFYNDAQSQAIFLSGNKFYYATENTMHMRAFRAYFDFDDVLSELEESSSRLFMFFNGEITAIDKVSGKKPDMSGSVYDLQGRRVNKPVQGIFIKDGKKIVVED